MNLQTCRGRIYQSKPMTVNGLIEREIKTYSWGGTTDNARSSGPRVHVFVKNGRLKKFASHKPNSLFSEEVERLSNAHVIGRFCRVQPEFRKGVTLHRRDVAQVARWIKLDLLIIILGAGAGDSRRSVGTWLNSRQVWLDLGICCGHVQ